MGELSPTQFTQKMVNRFFICFIFFDLIYRVENAEQRFIVIFALLLERDRFWSGKSSTVVVHCESAVFDNDSLAVVFLFCIAFVAL